MQCMYIVASHGRNKRKASVVLCTESGNSGNAVHSKKYLWELLLMNANNGQKIFCTSFTWFLGCFTASVLKYWIPLHTRLVTGLLFPPPGGGIKHGALVFPGGHFPGTPLQDHPQMHSNTSTPVIKVLYAHTMHPLSPWWYDSWCRPRVV